MSPSRPRIQIPLAPAEAPQPLLARSLSFFLRQIALEPLITGPLLYILSNRQRLSQSNTALRKLRDLKLPFLSIETALKILKTLLAFGLLGRLQQFLNNWSQSNFSLTSQSKAKGTWTFQPPSSNASTSDTERELVVITGGASGFGYHMAQYFAKYTNAEIVILDIVAPPDHLQKDHANIHFYKLDLSIPMTSAENLINQTCDLIRQNHGHATVLINNAGIGRQNFMFNVAASGSPEQDANELIAREEAERQETIWLEKIMHVNLISYFSLIRQFVPGMVARGRGHIVTLASVASYATSAAGLADYSATKAGVMAMHESLSQELLRKGHSNIQTTIVHPFWARTNIIRDYATQLERMKVFVMGPEAVASRVVRQIVTVQKGEKIFVPGGMHWVRYLRALPPWASEVVRLLEAWDVRRAWKGK